MVAPLVPPVVHTEVVCDEHVTARPDDAVAVAVTGDCTNVTFASVLNVMVCDAFETVKDCCTGGAGLKLALPAWSAWIVHVPAVTRVMVAPVVPPVVHTEVVCDEDVTARPDEAGAVGVTVDWTTVRFA